MKSFTARFKSFDTTISISKGYIIRTNPSSKRIKHYPNSKEFQALKIRLLSKNIINIYRMETDVRTTAFNRKRKSSFHISKRWLAGNVESNLPVGSTLHVKYQHILNRAVASSIIGGGGADIHIYVFTHHKINRFQKKLIVQNTNIWISPPPPNYRASYGPAYCRCHGSVDKILYQFISQVEEFIW